MSYVALKHPHPSPAVPGRGGALLAALRIVAAAPTGNRAGPPALAGES